MFFYHGVSPGKIRSCTEDQNNENQQKTTILFGKYVFHNDPNNQQDEWNATRFQIKRKTDLKNRVNFGQEILKMVLNNQVPKLMTDNWKF